MTEAEDAYLDQILPHWRNPPQRGTVVPSRAMVPHERVIDGWQALCAACEPMPWTIGPFRSQWVDALIDAWVHNTEGNRHPEAATPEPTWLDLIEGELPSPPPLLPGRQNRSALGRHSESWRSAS